MIMILQITGDESRPPRKWIRSLLHPYSIHTRLRNADELSLLEVTYVHRRGDLRLDKVYRSCTGVSKTILCDKKISLKGSDFRRFEGYELFERWMENFLMELLPHAGSPHISFYDPDAQHPALAAALLQHTPYLTVVSNMPRFYENEAERLLQEMGAAMTVSNSIGKLSPCDILIAPDRIKRPLPAAADTPVFTVGKPLVSCGGCLITDYLVSVPEKYRPLIPEDMDENYILSGLYSLDHCQELGEILPILCGNETDLFTSTELIRRLNRHTEA